MRRAGETMNVLIVFAHHEHQSFNAALLQRSLDVLAREGHTVEVSDLYGMGFDPVASRSDFLERRFPERLQYDREQKHSTAHGTFSPDIASEVEKLIRCDCLILQFPLWWFSVPAILKGWFDRILVNGLAYGAGRRYDTGGLRGRRAMLTVTTAAYETMCSPGGLVGELDVVLWPIQNGTLAYTGFEVLPPFVGYSVSYVDDETRRGYLDAYEARLRSLATTPPIDFHRLADFGPDWKLKDGVEPRAIGQARSGALL